MRGDLEVRLLMSGLSWLAAVKREYCFEIRNGGARDVILAAPFFSDLENAEKPSSWWSAGHT